MSVCRLGNSVAFTIDRPFRFHDPSEFVIETDVGHVRPDVLVPWPMRHLHKEHAREGVKDGALGGELTVESEVLVIISSDVIDAFRMVIPSGPLFAITTGVKVGGE